MSQDDRSHVAAELEQQSGNTADPFASAVRATRMAMVITDPRQADNPIVFCNDAFVRLTGYARDEILGRNCRFLQGPATRSADVAAVRDAIGKRESIKIDLLNYRKDGSSFWNALLLSPVFDGGDLVYFFASQFDVTDRKRAEEQRFLLNRELDHRVKNMLATVQSVVVQTLRDANMPREVAGTVAGRLQALARSHDVLTEEAWASALLTDVIEGALEPVRARMGDRITVGGPDLRIKPRVATMLSLGVHELASNAMRFGSLSNATGRVAVRWTLEDGILDLEWVETGGPSVVAPNRKGYGTRVVERVLSAEFGGTAELHFLPEGIRFHLRAAAGGLGREATQWKTSPD